MTLYRLARREPTVQSQVQQMLNKNTLEKYLLNKYPPIHDVTNDKSLRYYAMDIKINI